MYLYGAGLVDSTITVSEVLMVISSGLSAIYIPLHQLMARRYRKAGPSYQKHNVLRSACFAVARVMTISWMAASGFGLVVAVRQPTCLPDNGLFPPWQAGMSCIIHRASVAASLVAFIASCVLLCSLEIPGRPFEASLLGITPPSVPRIRPVPTTNQSFSSFTSDKTQYPPHFDLEQGQIHRPRLQSALGSAEWLHGGTPMLPPLPRRSYSLGIAWSDPVPDPSRQSMIYASTARTQSTLSVSDMSAPSIYSAISRRPSAISSNSSIRSIPRQSPLSTMCRADEPEVPVIPDRFRSNPRPHLPHRWPTSIDLAMSERTLTMPAKVAQRHPSIARHPSADMVVAPLVIRKTKSATTLPHRHTHSYQHHHRHHHRPLGPRVPSYENLRKGDDVPSTPCAVEIDTYGSDGRLYEAVDPQTQIQGLALAQVQAQVEMERGRPGAIRRKSSRTLVKHRQPSIRAPRRRKTMV
ncbi:MAG: hypothetical protein M1830_005654 [Pleopsidium flavum]|nr:MAG: hypothetical protein M1830_005654 [Pleopsidium flavum]